MRMRGLATAVPQHLDSVWSHCVGYPGAADPRAFVDYMKACQIETTFYFAAVNDKSVPETLLALQTQTAVADFIASHQGTDPATLQRDFIDFAARLKSLPAPRKRPFHEMRAFTDRDPLTKMATLDTSAAAEATATVPAIARYSASTATGA